MLRRKGQNTFEIALLIAVVCAALIAIATFVKHSAEGHYSEGAKQLGTVYDPLKVSGTVNKTLGGSQHDIVSGDGTQTSHATDMSTKTVTDLTDDVKLDEQVFAK